MEGRGSKKSWKCAYVIYEWSLSATLATEVEEWCSLNLDNVASVTIGQRHTATDTIKQTLVYTGNALFSIKISVMVFFGLHL